MDSTIKNARDREESGSSTSRGKGFRLDIPEGISADMRIHRELVSSTGTKYSKDLVIALDDKTSIQLINNSNNTVENSMTLSSTSSTLDKPLSLSSGGTGASTRTSAFNNLSFLGVNPTSSATDTKASWSNFGTGYAFYNATGRLNGQPSQWGFVISYVNGEEIHQEFRSHTGTNATYYRKANSSTTTMPPWTRLLNQNDLGDITSVSVTSMKAGSPSGTATAGLHGRMQWAYRCGTMTVSYFFSRDFSAVKSISNGDYYTGVALPYKPISNVYVPVTCTNNVSTYTNGGNVTVYLRVMSDGNVNICYHNGLTYSSSISELNFSGVCCYTPVL